MKKHDIVLRKRADGLFEIAPLDTHLADAVFVTAQTIPVGKPFICEPHFPRNLEHHEKYFALLSMAWERGGRKLFASVDDMRRSIAVELGFFEVVKDWRTGEAVRVPKSIAFESMGQTRFAELYERTVEVLVEIGWLTREDAV